MKSPQSDFWRSAATFKINTQTACRSKADASQRVKKTTQMKSGAAGNKQRVAMVGVAGWCQERKVGQGVVQDTEKGITERKQIPTMKIFPIQRLLVSEQKDNR